MELDTSSAAIAAAAGGTALTPVPLIKIEEELGQRDGGKDRGKNGQVLHATDQDKGLAVCRHLPAAGKPRPLHHRRIRVSLGLWGDLFGMHLPIAQPEVETSKMGPFTG